jgi:phosphoglycerate dehydrogenase-like enzyme
MIAVLKARQDLTALLDVTDPEPPRSGAQLYGMPNVFLSTHIAGCIGDEVVRLADYMIEEFKAWRDGRPLRYAVTLKMLETMA